MKKRSLLFTVLIFLFILSACTPSNGEQTKGNTDPSPPANETATQNETSAEKITISGVLGDVTLDQPAKKVVALEWTYAEDLLSVDVQPVGMSDIEGYNRWVKIEKELGSGVVDVGTRQEPNLEAIAALEPDLIIAIKFRHEAIKGSLENIAPTVFFDPYPTDESIDQYAEMEATFKEIAKAVGKSDEADKVLSSLNAKYEEAKTALSSLESKDIIVTQAFSGSQAPEIRIFAPNSVASVVLSKMGLNNLFEPAQFEQYGYSTVNVEALTKYEDANYLYVVQDNDNIYTNQFKDNNVWKNLKFVKENRMYALGGDAWLFGGPLSAKTLVDRVQQVMTQ